jgi:hypothetical protein
VCPFGRPQRGNVKYIYVHILLGKRDSIPRADGCKWVKIMYTGGFGFSNSEGLVYVTRQIFHLMTHIQYNNMKTSTLLYIHIYLTYRKTSYIEYKGQQNKGIYTTPDSNKKLEYNSRNVIFAFEPLVPHKS